MNFKNLVILFQDEEPKLDELDKARLQKTSKVSRHKDMKLDHSVIPVKKVLTVEDGLENQLTGVAIYLLRTSTKRTLGEETFQREIMCGMLNAQEGDYLLWNIERTITKIYIPVLLDSCMGDKGTKDLLTKVGFQLV
jgi:hypothetical protein